MGNKRKNKKELRLRKKHCPSRPQQPISNTNLVKCSSLASFAPEGYNRGFLINIPESGDVKETKFCLFYKLKLTFFRWFSVHSLKETFKWLFSWSLNIRLSSKNDDIAKILERLASLEIRLGELELENQKLQDSVARIKPSSQGFAASTPIASLPSVPPPPPPPLPVSAIPCRQWKTGIIKEISTKKENIAPKNKATPLISMDLLKSVTLKSTARNKVKNQSPLSSLDLNSLHSKSSSTYNLMPYPRVTCDELTTFRKSLKKVEVKRSPGGTPMYGKQNQDFGEGITPLMARALKKRFLSLQSPSPSKSILSESEASFEV